LTPARICFVLPSLNGGGAERAAVHILNHLAADRWERSMFLFSRTGPYLDELDPSIALASASGSGRWAQWQSLRAYIRRTKPQVVVSFLSYFSVLTAVRAAAVGARVVFNQQTPMSAFLEDGDYPWRRGWRRAVFNQATRTGYAAADLIVTTSKGVADDLVETFGVRRENIAVVPNPVDVEAVTRAAAQPIDPQYQSAWTRPVIVAAGRLAEAKNYPLLIDAIAELRKQIDVRLFILGTGELEPAIRERIRQRGLDASIILCGFQKNPWKYIGKADVFALSSRYEGFGNVLIEAMACGVPVVATKSAGTTEIVRHDVDGLLVDTHDPSSLSRALATLIADPKVRERMSAAAVQGAERFALPRIARLYDETLMGALA
jgi:glycosyltransferase involved in cell wall biosynthesis